jgi:polyisoprenoid-binding protein YceI
VRSRLHISARRFQGKSNECVTNHRLLPCSWVKQAGAVKLFHLLFTMAGCLLITGSPALANEIFKIDPEHSSIEFKVGHFLGTTKGRFAKFSGTIDVNREHAEESSVTATIQAASIDTAVAKRDEHLRGEDFFNIRKFPEITFKSRQVKRSGPGAGEVVGDLTMHGVTRPITLRFQLVGSPESAAKSGTTRWRITAPPLKRSEFGLVWSKSVEAVSMIGDDVIIEMEIEAARAP